MMNNHNGTVLPHKFLDLSEDIRHFVRCVLVLAVYLCQRINDDETRLKLVDISKESLNTLRFVHVHTFACQDNDIFRGRHAHALKTFYRRAAWVLFVNEEDSS